MYAQFFKKKLLKSLLRSIIKQVKLNILAIIKIESEMLDRISYEDIIKSLTSKNSHIIMLFK